MRWSVRYGHEKAQKGGEGKRSLLYSEVLQKQGHVVGGWREGGRSTKGASSTKQARIRETKRASALIRGQRGVHKQKAGGDFIGAFECH